jgi:hypothetical protein
MNGFSGIISAEFKSLFNNAINALLEQGALTIPCTIKYGSSNPVYCNNCEIDPIANRSSNIYNGSGPNPFIENTICPVCLGQGFINANKSEIVYMAVLFSEAGWFQWGSKTVKIPDGMAQSICKTELVHKLKNADTILFNNSESSTYVLASDPELVGLGETNYAITMWKKQI